MRQTNRNTRRFVFERGDAIVFVEGANQVLTWPPLQDMRPGSVYTFGELGSISYS